MKFAIAANSASTVGWEKTAPRFGHSVVLRAHDAFELVAGLEAFQPDVVLAWADPQTLNAGVLSQCDARGIKIIAVVDGDADRRWARQLGLFEHVSSHEGWNEIDAVVFAEVGLPVLTTTAPSRSSVIAVWGPAGAPGRSTAAISIARELAQLGFSVALADADPHSASLGPMLGMLDEAPGFAAACRLAGADGLTHAELERVAQRYSTPAASFWVLTGIGQPSRWPELSAGRVDSVIAQCRSWVDFTVVDTGFSFESDEEISSDLFAPRRNASTIAALRGADHIVAVGSADPVGLSRFLRAHAELLELVETVPVSVVVNKVRSSAVGIDAARQVRQTLDRFGAITDAHLVPFDQVADTAVLAAKAIADVAPRSAARIALRQFVKSRLAVGRERPQRPERLRERWPWSRRKQSPRRAELILNGVDPQ